MRRFLIVIVLCLGFMTACTQQGGKDSKSSVGISKEIKRGPVIVMVTTDKKEMTVAEQLKLTISVTANEEYNIELPGSEGKLDQFTVVDFSTAQPKLLDDGLVQVSRSYILEPFLAGNYTLPPMKIYFSKKDAAMDERRMVETPKLKILVTSLLPEDAKEIKINDIIDPVKLPYSVSSVIWMVILFLLLVIAVVLFIIMRHRKSMIKEQEVVVIPPHVIALKSLDELAAEDLPGAGKVKLFYQRVSYILRTYIEDRFGLRAPEQTTEEFMLSLRESSRLPKQYQSLLETFLKHCDLVKFAELHPDEDEIKKTFESCKAFVIGTMEKEDSGDRILTTEF